jgi:cytochrome c
MARGSFRTPTSSKGLKPDEDDTIGRDCCWNAGGGLELCPVRADVVKTKGCVACHTADQKKVGPSYKDLAAKYSGDKAAEDKLVAKLKEGKAHPKTAASDSELKAAVAYILSVK